METPQKTNLQKWFSYTNGLPTPTNMVQWGWTSLIGSALQRRVWLPPDHKPIFANNYICFVSPPGVGKSLIIDEVSSFARFWKIGDNKEMMEAKFADKAHKLAADAMVSADKDRAEKVASKEAGQNKEMVKPNLIPIAADASTYEALVLAFGNCYGRINYPKLVEGKETIGTYGHSSLCFLLKELGSLLRKRTNDTVTFLLGLYDCPLDYEYDTVSREKDRIRKGCLNILAATNPSFMNQIFEERLIDDAFLSRTVFVYAPKNRKAVAEIPDLTPEQTAYGNDIRQHILKLSTLYGPVKITDEARKWIADWFQIHETEPKTHASQHPKLIHFKSRMLLHMKKLAMCYHFGESTEMVMGIAPFQWAVNVLNQEIKTMHLALLYEAKDKQAQMVRGVSQMLQNGGASKLSDIAIYIHQNMGYVDKEALTQAIAFLVDTNQICQVEEPDDTGERFIKWKMK